MVWLTPALNVFAAVFLGAVFLASGARLRAWLRLPVGPHDRWAVDLMLGGGICTLWVLGLGLTGFLTTPAVLVGLIVQTAIGRWRVPRPCRPLAIAALAGLPHLIVAAGPPHFYDAMVYHLGLPWLALVEGGWTAHAEDLFSAFPPLAQMTAVPALAVGLVRAPGLLHWLAWMSAAVAAGGLSRRLGGPKSITGSVIATVMLLPVTPLVPGFPAAEGWFLAALLPAIGAMTAGRNRKGSFVLAALLIGLAAATRLQALPWIIVLLLLSLRNLPPVSLLARAAALAALGAAPWWLKNLILLHDPTGPIFWKRDGMETLWRDGLSLAKSGLMPTEIIVRIPRLLTALPPTVLPTLGAALLTAAFIPKSRRLVAAAVLGTGLWATTGALPRFFAPVLILLIVVISTWNGRRLFRTIAVIVVVANLGSGLAIEVRWLRRARPLSIFGLDFVAAAPLVAPDPPFAAYSDLDQCLPDTARLLLISEPRVFGVPRPALVPSQHDPSPMRSLCEGATPVARFPEILSGRDITHLVVNTGELARLSGDYPVAPWKTIRGEARWKAFLRTLGAPVAVRDGIETYELPPPLRAGVGPSAEPFDP